MGVGGGGEGGGGVVGGGYRSRCGGGAAAASAPCTEPTPHGSSWGGQGRGRGSRRGRRAWWRGSPPRRRRGGCAAASRAAARRRRGRQLGGWRGQGVVLCTPGGGKGVHLVLDRLGHAAISTVLVAEAEAGAAMRTANHGAASGVADGWASSAKAGGGAGEAGDGPVGGTGCVSSIGCPWLALARRSHASSLGHTFATLATCFWKSRSRLRSLRASWAAMWRPPPLQRPTRFARGCYRAALWGHAWEERANVGRVAPLSREGSRGGLEKLPTDHE
jgi:hypothetical protein